jgi:hypothetical protein
MLSWGLSGIHAIPMITYMNLGMGCEFYFPRFIVVDMLLYNLPQKKGRVGL